MSSLNIATLPRINRDALAALLKAGTTPAKLAIIDVRDSGMMIPNAQSCCASHINLSRSRWWTHPLVNLGS
jgi:hypothetical protein